MTTLTVLCMGRGGGQSKEWTEFHHTFREAFNPEFLIRKNK